METKASNNNGNHGLVSHFQDYIERMISISGMKALVLDKETTKMFAMVCSLSDVIGKQVFLVESLKQAAKHMDDKKADQGVDGGISHLKCVVFVRPTRESITMLESLLRTPKYKEFHIFFSNTITEDRLKDLALADEFHVVRQVQEFYADYYAYDRDLWSLNLFHTRPLHQTSTYWGNSEKLMFQRSVDGIIAVLLAHKRRPAIRYGVYSTLAKHLGTVINKRMNEEKQLFAFRQDSEPLLLILDRREDPVTPLLTQWTYRAMTHELLNINDNRIDMKNVPGISKDLFDIVLAPHQDEFYNSSLLLNFGDLGIKIKELVTNFQRQTKNTSELNSIEAMQKFVDNFPEYKQKSGNVSKHVAVMSELSRQVDTNKLMTVSEVEQDIACSDNHALHVQELFRIVEDDRIKFPQKLHLVMLYALRYEKQRNELQQFIRVLRDRATSEYERASLALVTEIVTYCGVDQRGGDLFSNKSFLAKVSSTIKTGLNGVENIYTQHKPLLSSTLTDLLTNKLKTTDFPFIDNNGNAKAKVDTIFVFMVGGYTYEEAHAVRVMNDANPGVKIILGGSCIHNAKSFCDDVLNADVTEDVKINIF